MMSIQHFYCLDLTVKDEILLSSTKRGAKTDIYLLIAPSVKARRERAKIIIQSERERDPT